jgi:hypothetical protein
VKVAIVCGSPSSEFLAPFDDPEWEIWVLGNRVQRFKDKRVTRLFEIHDCLEEHKEPLKYAEYLSSLNIPMIVAEKFPVQAPHLTVFDYAQSEKLFGSLYLTSSPAYMMSQAISEGATHIGVYGVDLAVDDHEYYWQRPCMEAWIGFAKGRGIEVVIPAVSSVGRADYVEGRHWDGKKNEYNSRKSSKAPFTEKQLSEMADTHRLKQDDIQSKINELTLTINVHSGAQQAYERLAKVARAIESGMSVNSLTDSALIK